MLSVFSYITAVPCSRDLRLGWHNTEGPLIDPHSWRSAYGTESLYDGDYRSAGGAPALPVEQEVTTVSPNSAAWNVRLHSLFTSASYKCSNYLDLLDLTTFAIIHHSSSGINSPTTHAGLSLQYLSIASLRHRVSLPRGYCRAIIGICVVLWGIVLFGPLVEERD